MSARKENVLFIKTCDIKKVSLLLKRLQLADSFCRKNRQVCDKITRPASGIMSH
jgi:hypothetical protein